MPPHEPTVHHSLDRVQELAQTRADGRRTTAVPARDWRVVKIGGTTAANPVAVRAAVDHTIGLAARKRVAVVVSAFAGVTDEIERLLTVPLTSSPSAIDALAARHVAYLGHLVERPEPATVARIGADFASLRGLLGALAVGRSREDLRVLALSLGERVAARIVHSVLASSVPWVELVDPTWLLVADGARSDACPNLAASRRRTAGHLATSAADIWVVPGFYAQDAQCRLRLLGRGGSDTSATLLGAALDADCVEIWTDVDGVYATDPRHDPSTPRYDHLDYGSAETLATRGARVLHARSIAPARSADIPILVRDAVRHDSQGTWIGRHAGQGVWGQTS